MTEPICDRPGCGLPATWERLVATSESRGFNLNEPGAKIEVLCHAHANEVATYVGGWIKKLPEGEVCNGSEG